MNQEEQWLLPEGVGEILPPAALAVETLRRELLNQFSRWGYQLVFPPLVEFLESLLNGAGRDLANETCTFTDRSSGRTIGVRADMTPQVARMDAHSLQRQGPARLCYCSTALRSSVPQTGGSRLPYQIGVELFGHEGFASDVEVISLLLDTLNVAGAEGVTLELGHVGIFRALIAAAGLDASAEATLSDIYLRKAVTELESFLDAHELPENIAKLLQQLPWLCGGADVLSRASQAFAEVPEAQAAIDELQQRVDWLTAAYPQVSVYLDLGELRGYHYHTGCVFSAYLPEQSEPVAKGGRYDHIGEVFGRARPATGFSANLKTLAGIQPVTRQMAILAEGDIRDAIFRDAIQSLREQGETVILALPGVTNEPGELGCDRCLQLAADGSTRIVSISKSNEH